MTSIFNDRSDFFISSIKTSCFPDETDILKVLYYKVLRAIFKKKWQSTVECRKKFPIVTFASTWDPRSPADSHVITAKHTLLMALVIQQVPNWAVQRDTKSHRSTEMAKASSHVHCWSRLNYATDKFVPCLHSFFLSVKMTCVGLCENCATEGIQNQHLCKYLTNPDSLIRPKSSSTLPFVKLKLCLHS